IRLKPDRAEAHCNLGLLLGKGGDYQGAVEALRRGHELGSKRPGWPYPSAQWLHDAERMLDLAERLTAILNGDAKPKDTAERRALVQMCYDAGRFAAAARVWVEALAADSRLGDDRDAGYRYNAACAAALAAAGAGAEDPKPDDAARTGLRRQALNWLQAEL